MEQTTIDRGTLAFWTKGFNCPDAPGKDVVELLQRALDAKHIKVRVNALVNDTVGALLTRSYQTGGALLGAIFGTGTNGAYLERLEKIKKIKVHDNTAEGKSDAPSHMVINTEWGSFDNEVRVGLFSTDSSSIVDLNANTLSMSRGNRGKCYRSRSSTTLSTGQPCASGITSLRR